MPDITPQELAACAADLLETHGWTQGRNARDGAGRPVDNYSEKASSFCLVGAVLRCGSEKGPGPFSPEVIETFRLIEAQLPRLWRHRPLVQFNDSGRRTKEQVIALLRKAAKAEPQT